jgi:hypothetical protein
MKISYLEKDGIKYFNKKRCCSQLFISEKPIKEIEGVMYAVRIYGLQNAINNGYTLVYE